MGNTQNVYYKYNSNGDVVTGSAYKKKTGWIQILDITYQNDKYLSVKVKAGKDFPYSLRQFPYVFMFLKKKNVDYFEISNKLKKNASLYVEIAKPCFDGSGGNMIIRITEPKSISARIIFGKYEPYFKYDFELFYYRILPPDVFEINKTESHRTCERLEFLVDDKIKFDFVEDQEYGILATNIFDRDIYLIDSICLLE
jgi:hypothetical protein